MANVLSEQKRQQVIALGRLGWPLRRIETSIGVRRGTASAYLKEGGHSDCPARVGPRTKTGQRGVHRLRRVKTGQWRGGVHRLCHGAATPPRRGAWLS